MTDTQGKVDSFTARIDKADETIQRFTEEHSAIRSEVRQQHGDVTAKLNKLKTINNDIERFKARVSADVENLRKHQDRTDESIHTSIGALDAKLTQRIDTLEARIHQEQVQYAQRYIQAIRGYPQHTLELVLDAMDDLMLVQQLFPPDVFNTVLDEWKAGFTVLRQRFDDLAPSARKTHRNKKQFDRWLENVHSNFTYAGRLQPTQQPSPRANQASSPYTANTETPQRTADQGDSWRS